MLLSVIVSTYLPPWVLMIGFPVRVIAMSEMALGVDELVRTLLGRAAARSPFMVEELQDFCIFAGVYKAN